MPVSMFNFPGLYFMSNWKSDPLMTRCVEFRYTHDISQRIVVSEDGEVSGIVKVIPKLFTHSPF